MFCLRWMGRRMTVDYRQLNRERVLRMRVGAKVGLQSLVTHVSRPQNFMSSAFRVLRLASRPALQLRSASAAARTALTTRPLVALATRSFASSIPVADATPGSRQLLEKLTQELNYEIEHAHETGVDDKPEFLVAFEQEGVWEIQDKPGNDEVFLTRKFGNETIRVMFSVADLQGFDEKDVEEPELDAAGAEKDPAVELRVSVSITKVLLLPSFRVYPLTVLSSQANSPSALNIDMFCADGLLHTANVTYFKSREVATELTMESDFKRRTVYSGPIFESLDAGLQDSFATFLDERGLNASLAEFIPAYAEHKEQQEYVDWLDGVSKFVEA
ncbi:hypothetical protein HMN09_00383500 [Mycena chlorophos]|uniref:Mitochondrial glyco protein n=1 Tax=Mycena chlorophos TaxID=658473 RepID=A0A8H6TL78_MYCCL|nr:hypothetical protein HMN09_00383500 [Mycena chlorophos]